MKTLRRIGAPVLLAACLVACGGVGNGSDAAASGQALTPEQVEGLLRMVNDCAIDLATLDDDAGLDARAARGIIERRNGPDGVCGTSDDRPFATIDALDAVAYVGSSALDKLAALAVERGYVQVGRVFDGVSFSGADIERVLAVVNTATQATLDDEVGLDTRAASGIVAARPFNESDPLVNMAALAAVPYVGTVALELLKAYVPSGPGSEPAGGCEDLAGTFEGVSFTAEQAHDVLDLANRGSEGDLDAVSGIGPVLAARIVTARPFTSITALGEVSGIGASVLGALRDDVALGWCQGAGASCGCDGGPVLPDYSGTFDGVAFTTAEAAAAMGILNQASIDQLRADGGFDQSVAERFIAGRPWADLGALAATSGVGAATMRGLRGYASSGLWQGPGEMRSATTVTALLANPARWDGQMVSINSAVVETITNQNNVFSAWLKDPSGSGATIQLVDFLCADSWDSGVGCHGAPPITVGDTVTLVGVRAEIVYKLRLTVSGNSIVRVQ